MSQRQVAICQSSSGSSSGNFIPWFPVINLRAWWYLIANSSMSRVELQHAAMSHGIVRWWGISPLRVANCWGRAVVLCVNEKIQDDSMLQVTEAFVCKKFLKLSQHFWQPRKIWPCQCALVFALCPQCNTASYASLPFPAVMLTYSGPKEDCKMQSMSLPGQISHVIVSKIP